MFSRPLEDVAKTKVCATSFGRHLKTPQREYTCSQPSHSAREKAAMEIHARESIPNGKPEAVEAH